MADALVTVKPLEALVDVLDNLLDTGVVADALNLDLGPLGHLL